MNFHTLRTTTMVLTIWMLAYSTHLYGQSAPTPATPSTLEMMVIPVGFLILMYVVFIRPGAKKFKEQKEFIAALKPRDSVVTTGGIIGQIHSIQNETVAVEVGCGRIKILKQNILPNPQQQASTSTTTTPSASTTTKSKPKPKPKT